MTSPDSLQALLLTEGPISEINLDSITELLKAFERRSHRPEILDNLYRDLGWKHFNNRNYGSAYLAFERSLWVAQSSNDAVQEAYTRLAIGQLYMELKHHNQASQNLKEGLFMARRLDDSELLKYAFNCIIELEYSHGNYQLAESYALEAIERFQTEPADMSFHFYNVLGLIDLHFNRFADAKIKFLASLKAAENRPEIDKGFLYGNLGSAYIGLNQLDSAWYFLELDVRWSLERQYTFSAFTANIGKMEVLLKAGKQNTQLVKDLLALSDSLTEAGNLVVKPHYYDIQLQLLAKLSVEDQKNALSKMLMSLSEKSLSKSKNDNQELRNIQQLSEAIQTLQVATKEAEVAKKLRITLWISGLTVLLLAIGITWVYQLKKRHLLIEKTALYDTIALEKNFTEELQKQVEIKNYEISALQQQNARLEASLEFHQNRLEHTTMSQEYLLSVKQKTIDRFVHLWESLPEIPANLKRSIHLALNELDQLEQAALHLTPGISQKNMSLEEQLHTSYPELTADEIKILTYIRMNMSTAEIARLKSITIAGVNKSRNRIRKKLGLQPTTDLRDFVMSL